MWSPATRLWIGLISVALLAVLIWWVGLGPIYELNEETALFIPLQSTPAGMQTLRAEECGNCHSEIYREWQGSLHANAYRDPFFQAYFRKDDYHPSCLVCHTPLQNQLEQQVSYTGRVYSRPLYSPNPDFDPRLREEGVTCAACHVRDGVIYGPYPADDLNSPHPVAYDPKFTSKSICLTCHQVPARPFSLMPEGVCSTGSEADAGPWAERGAICQDCHMEKIERPLVAEGPARPGRRHTWPGGYSDPQLRKVFGFIAKRQSDGRIRVSYSNQGAGHKAPTGDPDRSIQLRFLWRSGSGEERELAFVEFRRRILWYPFIIELADNRLAPGESDFFEFRIPEGEGDLLVTGDYRVMSDWSLRRLRKNYGLKDHPPITRRFLEQVIPVEL